MVAGTRWCTRIRYHPSLQKKRCDVNPLKTTASLLLSRRQLQRRVSLASFRFFQSAGRLPAHDCGIKSKGASRGCNVGSAPFLLRDAEVWLPKNRNCTQEKAVFLRASELKTGGVGIRRGEGQQRDMCCVVLSHGTEVQSRGIKTIGDWEGLVRRAPQTSRGQKLSTAMALRCEANCPANCLRGWCL